MSALDRYERLLYREGLSMGLAVGFLLGVVFAEFACVGAVLWGLHP
jgi:hypothetical protein